jgi:hypothetical protein
MSVKLAKIAVALLYAATVVIVLKEFVGHVHHQPDKHAERQPEAISSWLAAGAKDLALRAKRYRAALTNRRFEAPPHLALIALLTAVMDTATHEHPVDHQTIMPRRRGKRWGWKEPMVLSLLLAAIRLRPPANGLWSHRLRVRRLAESKIIVG